MTILFCNVFLKYTGLSDWKETKQSESRLQFENQSQGKLSIEIIIWYEALQGQLKE